MKQKPLEGKVLAAINARFGQHGVIASDNGVGITLTADDGRNVSACPMQVLEILELPHLV